MIQQDWQAVIGIARDVLATHDGVAKMSTFLEAGLTNRQVAALCAQGHLERPRNGWYVDPALSWQAKCAIRVGGMLGCTSAVDSFGLPVPNTGRRHVHVVVPLNSARLRHHRDRQHYVVPGEDQEIAVHWSTGSRALRGWRTGLVDALLLLVGCVPPDWFVAALDAALHRPKDGAPVLCDAEWRLLRLLLPRRKRHLLDLVDPRSESCIETLLRLGMRRRGIGPVTLQFSPDGRHRVDFLVGDRLIVEVDGEAFHDPEQDAVRDAAWRRLGYEVLRFPYDRVVNDLDAVLDEIAAALLAIESAF